MTVIVNAPYVRAPRYFGRFYTEEVIPKYNSYGHKQHRMANLTDHWIVGAISADSQGTIRAGIFIRVSNYTTWIPVGKDQVTEVVLPTWIQPTDLTAGV